jgi:hypothetical protein
MTVWRLLNRVNEVSNEDSNVPNGTNETFIKDNEIPNYTPPTPVQTTYVKEHPIEDVEHEELPNEKFDK